MLCGTLLSTGGSTNLGVVVLVVVLVAVVIVVATEAAAAVVITTIGGVVVTVVLGVESGLVLIGGIVLAVVGVEGAVTGVEGAEVVVAVALVTVMVTVVVLGPVVVANVPCGISPVWRLALLALRRASLLAFSSFHLSHIFLKALSMACSSLLGSVSFWYSSDSNMISTSGSHC